MPVPAQPKIYHITHVENLRPIIRAAALWSDAKRIELGLETQVVGMAQIKRRRLDEIDVDCHAGTTVGQYVPFYFCPRSIMLYILHRGNHPDLDYTEGQEPIVHLQADLHSTVNWANERGVRWAFCNSNAGARYTTFFSALAQLDRVNWSAISNADFRDPVVKEGKQAEFLIFEQFPWELVESIGVIDEGRKAVVQSQLEGAGHQPLVQVQRRWYF